MADSELRNTAPSQRRLGSAYLPTCATEHDGVAGLGIGIEALDALIELTGGKDQSTAASRSSGRDTATTDQDQRGPKK